MNQSALDWRQATREATNEGEASNAKAISRAIASELQGIGKATGEALLYVFQLGRDGLAPSTTLVMSETLGKDEIFAFVYLSEKVTVV